VRCRAGRRPQPPIGCVMAAGRAATPHRRQRRRGPSICGSATIQPVRSSGR
jgi:hypothetical protein